MSAHTNHCLRLSPCWLCAYGKPPIQHTRSLVSVQWALYSLVEAGVRGPPARENTNLSKALRHGVARKTAGSEGKRRRDSRRRKCKMTTTAILSTARATCWSLDVSLILAHTGRPAVLVVVYCILPVEIKDTARALNLPAHSPGKPQCDIKNIALQFPIEKQWGERYQKYRTGGGLFDQTTLPGHYLIPSHAPNTSGLHINQIHNKQTLKQPFYLA